MKIRPIKNIIYHKNVINFVNKHGTPLSKAFLNTGNEINKIPSNIPKKTFALYKKAILKCLKENPAVTIAEVIGAIVGTPMPCFGTTALCMIIFGKGTE